MNEWWAIPILAAGALALYLPLRQKNLLWLFLEPEDAFSDLKKLKEEKATFILALKELDFDFEVGKLSKEDYKLLRERYESQTVEILKKLELLEGEWKTLQEKITSDIQNPPPAGEPS